MTIQTNASDRKNLVKTLAEITLAEAKYSGPPTFFYTVDYCTVDRNGAISFDCRADSKEIEKLVEELARRGFIDREDKTDDLEINVPIEGMDGPMLRNLVFMLKSKQYLLNRVMGRETFEVSDELIAALAETEPLDAEAFFTLCSQYEIRGLSFGNGNAAFTFPLSENPDKNRAYTELAAFMVARAKEAVRVYAAEQKPDNEKYYLRTWLIRLGFTGDGAKDSRKALLSGLHGHTAFRTPADAERHTARLAARKVTLAETPEGE